MVKHIFLEINEICPHLIDYFESKNLLPNFKKYRADFNQYTTYADADPPALEPWIQWYSLHTGLPYQEHGVFRLTEGANAGHRDIWTHLKENGYRVMNFGSMNAAPLTGADDFYFPDPWSNTKANPESLQPIADFIANQVRDYTVPNKKINYTAFATSLMAHGLNFSTVLKAVKQLACEKFGLEKTSYKRIFILDSILMDLFFHHHHKHQPDFATFFTNSVAHIQHAYWRYFEPEKFELQSDRPEFKNAIQDAYINMDTVFGRLVDYTRRYNIKLSVASALSQRPYVKEEKTGGRRYYRPRAIDDLLKTLGIVADSCEPVMTHQYILRFANDDAKQNAYDILTRCQLIDDTQQSDLFTVQDADKGIGLIFDCKPRNLVTKNAQALIHNQNYQFDQFFYLIDEIKSGGHDPIGLYWQETNHGMGKKQDKTFIVHNLYHELLEPYKGFKKVA